MQHLETIRVKTFLKDRLQKDTEEKCKDRECYLFSVLLCGTVCSDYGKRNGSQEEATASTL